MKKPELIVSRKNPQIQFVTKLGLRKYRKRENCFIVEGFREIQAAIRQNYKLNYLFCLPNLSDFAENYSPKSSLITEDLMFYLTKRENLHEAIAIFEQKWHDFSAQKVDNHTFWIALESPKKQNNVGAIIRTAEAVGANGLILLDDFCDPYSTESIRSSCGAIFDLPLIASTAQEMVSWVKNNQIQLIGTGIEKSQNYRLVNYLKPTILLMGTEFEGLSLDLKNKCDEMVFIPIYGKSNSLNLSVASGIILYEISHQKRELKG